MATYTTLPTFTMTETLDLETFAGDHPEVWVEESFAATGPGDRLEPVERDDGHPGYLVSFVEGNEYFFEDLQKAAAALLTGPQLGPY